MRSVFAAALLAAMLSGCQQDDAPPAGEKDSGPAASATAAPPSAATFTHVISAETEYYTDGPQQMRPPDGRFAAGTEVTLLRESGSYSLVRTADGIEAYVAADALERIDSQ